MECTIDEIRQLIRGFIEKRLSHDPCSQEYVSMLVDRYLAEIAHSNNNNFKAIGNSCAPKINRGGMI